MINENDKVVKAAQAEHDAEPIALLCCTDLMFGVQLQKMARLSGYRAVTVRPGAVLPQADIMVVDLAARGDWQGAIREGHARGIPVVAFGPHMDTEARRLAKQAGAVRVLANSNLARDLPGILAAARPTGDKQ